MQKTQNQAVAEQTNNTVGWDNPTPTTPIGVDYKNIFRQPEKKILSLRDFFDRKNRGNPHTTENGLLLSGSLKR